MIVPIRRSLAKNFTLNIGSTSPWNTLLDLPRPDRGFNITSTLGGLLHLIWASKEQSLGTKSEACFFDDTSGCGKQLT